MQKLKVNLENCYGIKKFNHEFDFTAVQLPDGKRKLKNVKVIYAPNGIMKTSFLKTFDDIANGKMPKEERFGRTAKYEIKIDNQNIIPSMILAVKSYDEAYASDSVSHLLAKKELKEDYDKAHFEIANKQNELIKAVKSLSGLKTFDLEFISAYSTKEFVEAVELSKMVKTTEFDVNKITYGDIFNADVEEFLTRKDIISLLEDYSAKYDELCEGSELFEKKVFDHTQFSAIGTTLKSNNYFVAGHKMQLKNNVIITTTEEWQKLLEDEKIKILNTEDLKNKFDEIDKAINKNAKLRAFKNAISAMPEILLEITEYINFKKQVLVKHLRSVPEYEIFIKEVDNSKEKLKNILAKTKAEVTIWEEIINIYNSRFDVPFVISIENKEDVILKEEAPAIVYTFKDRNDEKSCKKEDTSLMQTLSQGEKKALYVLNVIFEVEARKRANAETLALFDDIADSFDYRNKYAIIEYLNDIQHSNNFNIIIMTHNFDFYRTVTGRLGIVKGSFYFANKNDTMVNLERGKYKNDVFSDWKKEVYKNSKIMLACIPFARNIIQYTKGEKSREFVKLTSILHLKEDTKELRIRDYNEIWNNLFEAEQGKVFANQDEKIYDIIMNEADTISGEDIGCKLEDKIILSIAIRLLAEECIEPLYSAECEKEITENQTRELFDWFAETYPDEKNANNIFGRVSLITTENIHINAFMYEPILDLTDKHLKDLYNDLKTLLKQKFSPFCGNGISRNQT